MINRMRLLSSLLTAAACCTLCAGAAYGASGVKKVSGVYTYYGDRNDSPAMSKRKALEGARLDAIAKEFGTIVSQDIVQAERMGSNGESTNFFALSSSEVKGEWIADSGDPVYEVSLDKDDNLVVRCTISGTARGLTNEAVDFEALALRNGSRREMASTEYHSGDDLFLWFSAPVDGYVGVYLMLENDEVWQMLPYPTDPGQEVKVKKDYEYVFFDRSKAEGTFGEIQEFEIATDGDVEFNKLYVIFSPNAFSRPVMHAAKSDQSLPYLSPEEFSRWLVKNRSNDSKMNVKQINLKLFPD